GLVDGVDVLAAGGLADAFDGRANRRLVALRHLVAGFLHELLDIVSGGFSLVAGVDQVAALLVLLGVRLGFAAHLFDLAAAQTAGAFDADLLLLAGPQVLRGDVQDAVVIDVEGDLDLRHAARRGGNVLQVELAQQAVGRAVGNGTFALEDAHRN